MCLHRYQLKSPSDEVDRIGSILFSFESCDICHEAGSSKLVFVPRSMFQVDDVPLSVYRDQAQSCQS